LRTSNPALSDKVFQDQVGNSGPRMTIQGAVNKSLMMICLVIGAAYFSWQSAYPGGWTNSSLPEIPSWYLPVIIIAFIIALVIIFKKTWAPVLAPVYALLEGSSLGALSAIFETRYPGIVLQAVLCTFGTFFALLMVYKSGLIKVTENFKLGLIAATGGIAIVYVIDMVISFFGMNVPLIHENGPLGIGVSIFITIVAALNLVLDFDFIEKGAESGAPKFMEWYSAFGLLVTLIWLYLEILRLLSKGRKR